VNPSAAPLRRWEVVGLLIIVLAAVALRMGAPGISEFKRDEANLSQKALDLARGRDLPWRGIDSSVGVPNPPINVYLFALPYAIDDTPLLATLFVGTLNVLAVGLTWGMAHRYYGPQAALVAGLLYAASPWGVLYSRKIWAQNLLPPFIAATVFTGLLGYGEGKRWVRVLHWPLLALTVQIHYGAFTLLPLSLAIAVLWWRRSFWRATILGIGLAVLTVAPLLVGVLQHDLLRADTVHTALDTNGDHRRVIDSTALEYAWFTVAGQDIHSLAGPEQFRNYLDTVPDVYPLFHVIPLGAVLAAGWLAWRTLHSQRLRHTPDGILVLWLLLPVLVFTWQWTEVAPHYMIPLMPAAYIAWGAGAARMWRAASPLIANARVRRGVAVARGAGLLVVVGLQAYLLVCLLDFVDTHDTPGGFGTPLHRLLAVRDAVLDQSPARVLVISHANRAPEAQEPAVWSVLLDPVPDVGFVNGTQTAVVPAGDTLALIAYRPNPDGADEPGLPEYKLCVEPGCLDGAGQVFGLRGTGHYVVRPITPGAWSQHITPVEPVHFSNGAALTGYALRNDAVLLRWQLQRLAAPRDYQVSVKVFAEDGFAQLDRAGWPGRYWRDDDMLYLWFEMALPDEPHTLDVGMYTLDGDRPGDVIEVVDENGAYVAQRAKIALVQ
jgi:4-amino-4-deoxy-L-arabinose transferase-like glycosyltransferase